VPEDERITVTSENFADLLIASAKEALAIERGEMAPAPLAGTIPAHSGGSMSMSYQSIITIEPGKRGGKPCIRGMRITVYDVLSYLAAGMTTEEILADFPYLTGDDIRACLSYAADREKQMLVAHARI